MKQNRKDMKQNLYVYILYNISNYIFHPMPKIFRKKKHQIGDYNSGLCICGHLLSILYRNYKCVPTFTVVIGIHSYIQIHSHTHTYTSQHIYIHTYIYLYLFLNLKGQKTTTKNPTQKLNLNVKLCLEMIKKNKRKVI